MKLSGSRASGLILLWFAFSVCLAQQPETSDQKAIRVQSSLVLVDVISQDPKNGLPVQDFKKRRLPRVRRWARSPYCLIRSQSTPRHPARYSLACRALTESKKHPAWKRLCGIPSIGPIRAAVLLGILQTPHRFRTKRQLWTYGGVGIETSSSADHQVVKGQLERKKKQVEIRRLNRNYNHDLKNLFKGAAIVAATKPGPFAEFYTELLAKGMRQEMARLTLARKIATIVLIVWKRGVSFDAQHLKPQTA
jgi:hypothetical protein